MQEVRRIQERDAASDGSPMSLLEARGEMSTRKEAAVAVDGILQRRYDADNATYAYPANPEDCW